MNQIRRLTAAGSHALLAAWTIFFLFLFDQFRVWDWGFGRRRALLLGALIAGYVFFRWSLNRVRLDLRPIRLVSLLSVGVVLGFGGLSLHQSWNAFSKATAARDGLGDQQQCALRALRLIERRVNPYGRRAFLDTSTYQEALRLYVASGCGSINTAIQMEDVTLYWATLNKEVLERLYPSFADTPDCRAIQRYFDSFLYKYGPFLLACYFPFVAVLGPGGIQLFQLIIFFGLALFLAKTVRSNSGSIFLASVAVAVLIVPYHVRWNGLVQAHSDLLPTALAVVFLVLWMEERHELAAYALGLSLAAKNFPALAFAPLLLPRWKKSWPFLATAAVAYVPFWIWDPVGMWHYWTFPLHRPPDSTSLLYFLPLYAQPALKIGCVSGISFLLWRALRRPDVLKIIDYAFLSLVLALLMTSQFHNNYLTWLLPTLSLALTTAAARSAAGL